MFYKKIIELMSDSSLRNKITTLAYETVKKYDEITVSELKILMDEGKNPFVLDVREPFELNIAKINGTNHIPMKEVETRISELNSEKEIIVQCKSGGRSAKICNLLILNICRCNLIL